MQFESRLAVADVFRMVGQEEVELPSGKDHFSNVILFLNLVNKPMEMYCGKQNLIMELEENIPERWG